MMKLLSILVLTLLLLLASCGGDDDDSTDEAPNDSTATESIDDGAGGEQQTDAPEGTDAPVETDSGGSGGDFHACDVLTKEEISAVVGYDVNDGVDYLAVSPQATQCEFGPGVYIEVLTEGGPEFYEAVHFGQDVEPVEGVGDEAVWNDGLFEAIEGDNYVAVQLVGFAFGNPGSTEQDEIDAAGELARLALENVP